MDIKLFLKEMIYQCIIYMMCISTSFAFIWFLFINLGYENINFESEVDNSKVIYWGLSISLGAIYYAVITLMISDVRLKLSDTFSLAFLVPGLLVHFVREQRFSCAFWLCRPCSGFPRKSI